MRIGVVQHTLRASAEEDARALGLAAQAAVDAGAELLVFPEVFSLHDHPARDVLSAELEQFSDSLSYLLPHVGPDSRSLRFAAAELPGISGRLGRVALLYGDACMDAAELEAAAAERPAVLVMAPRSESDLQAEAVLELALKLSDSAAGLVLVAEPDGAEPGEPGHGGSVVILLGQVLAEAVGGDDLLVFDVPEPVPQPTPRERLPAVPPMLAQRVAHHAGRKLAVDYPAELS
ncbi:MAG: hypothetical protein Q8K99_08705 [Actinomycetota bacterium]|nr:hypothetical protein [Actinomycetota bacterium]